MSVLRLPLQANDLGEIFDAADFPLADVFTPPTECEPHEPVPHASEEAAEIVRRVNLHDELVEALRKYQRAGIGNGADYFSQAEARDAAIAILAKVDQKEGR